MKNKVKMMLCLFMAASMVALVACAKKVNNQNGEESSSSSQIVDDQSGEESNSSSQNVEESNSSSQSKQTVPVLELLSPSGEVIPYIQNVIDYLKAGKGADVSTYYSTSDKNAFQPISVVWKSTVTDATAIRVEYSTKADYSDAVRVELTPENTKLDLYNLLKATEYHLRVTAIRGGTQIKSAETTFRTTDLGPRIMNIGGIHNVRDMGGYLTASGERTVQGLLFRGGALSPDSSYAYDHALDESGKKYMSETLGIKTDFDLRSTTENLGLTASPIPNATLEYYAINGYSSAFDSAYKEKYRKVFSDLSNQSKYPVYLHCTGGADRTGTVAFLINALLGVDETALIQDYEMTSFSVYGERNSQGDNFKPFLEKLKTYNGDTLSQKTENYMLSIGVTETEIYNIRAIMLGKPCKTA